MLAPFHIYVARDGKTLVRAGDESAAALVVATGPQITEEMAKRYDFAAILTPIPEGRSQVEGAPQSPEKEDAPASAPPEDNGGEAEPSRPEPPKSAEPPKVRGKR